MGKEFDSLEPAEKKFVGKQHLFFVASSPLSPAGKVNVSPKGYQGSFGFISQELGIWGMDHGLGCRQMEGVENEYDSMEPKGYFAYMDLGGSGTETVCHLRENGRMTVMFCSFDGAPKILRFFGRGVSLSEPLDDEEDREKKIEMWNRIVHEIDPSGEVIETYHVKKEDGKEMKIRNLVVMEIFRIRDSCGYVVPVMPFKENRNLFPGYYDSISKAEFEEKWAGWNRTSMDGLPGLTRFSQDVEDLTSSSSSITPKTPSPSPSPSSRSPPSPSPSPSPPFPSLVPLCGVFVAGVVVGLGIKSWITKK